jgi:hypothetical protein
MNAGLTGTGSPTAKNRVVKYLNAVLREGHAHQGHLVLGAPRARGPESLFDDQADPVRAP